MYAEFASRRATIIGFKGVAQDRLALILRVWLCLSLSVALAALGATPAAEDSRWKPLGESDGVAVYVRPFANSALPEVRATATVCATLPQLVAWVEDTERFDRWIPDTEQARLLARPSPREQIYYIRTSMPWPIKHRDMIYRLTEVPVVSSPSEVRVAMEGLPDYLPAYPGVIRMSSVSGEWRLRGEGRRTHIRLDLHIEPGGSLPAWLVKRRMVTTPSKMLKNLEREFGSDCPDAAVK